ncbi:phosphoserine phosphatase [Spathaspora passalidarum NRRL Y-27907]|uniref:phosphoserine phosphatase n=1 Tax=Spathaspora passalidarum (strain NRRL Y-27907 / 11-Y1) TaxID=619300 RepID=G3AMI2_SPAPN|nr:phosphoserine phosphatase [Spathaspora passalidarum NRRL Y-27907]EGW33427.1 phosphoserine phosphatase [Spathaspora passalidarum NRRL Y-27907]
MSTTLTVISHFHTLSQVVLDEITHTLLIDQLSIESYTDKRLSPRAHDFYFDISDLNKARSTIKTFSSSTGRPYDIIIQPSATRQNKKLFVFDMDSTLIYQEVIELIAAYADIEDKVAEITTRAMNGELDFNQSLAERVALLKGIDATNLWEELKEKIVITKGVRELTKALKRLGVTMAVLSGGFIPLAEYVKGELGLDYAYANTLGVDEHKRLDGTTIGTIVNGDRKAELLLEIAGKHGIDPKDAVAVGDGANDLKMMRTGGFGIAWNAKPKVQLEAPACLNTDSLQDVLYILGYTDEEINQLLK